MEKDRIRLTLEGSVTLADFSEAIGYFNELVNNLSKEVSQSADIQWRIADLEYGSATAVIQGYSADEEDIQRVTQAYQVVSNALVEKQSIPYSEEVRNAAYSLTSVIGKSVTSVQTEVEGYTAVVEKPFIEVAESEGKPFAFGSVTGKVETLSRRGRLRVVLYDHIFDQAINCYFQEDQQSLMRDIWGKRVTITGMVSRNPDNGKAIEVRKITDVAIVDDNVIGAFRKARGIISWDTDETPEQAIRRLRNGQ